MCLRCHCRSFSSFRAGDVTWPCCGRRWGGRTVASGGGGGGDKGWRMMVVGKEDLCLFTMCRGVSGKRR